MTKVLRGVVHGRVIEVAEDLGLIDGQAVELIVTTSATAEAPSTELILRTSPKTLPGPPPGWRPGVPPSSAGLLAAEWTEEDDGILEEIHQERRTAQWREVEE